MPQRAIGWVSDELVQRAVGADAFHRGAAYAHSGRVSDFRNGRTGDFVLASVQGSLSRPYQTIVWLSSTAGEVTDVHGACSCPVSTDCKHVAATLLAARRSAEPLATPRPAWEEILTELVTGQAQGAQQEGTPIGLQCERVPPPRPSRWASPEAPAAGGAWGRVRVRPVVPGRSGGWVRTGVSWRELSYDVWRPRVRAHREALRELYAAYRTRDAYSAYGDHPVYLDEFGSSLWPLLARVVEAGVELVPAKTVDGPVTLAAEAATISLDITRAAGSTGATLAAVVTVEGQSCPPAAAHLLGQPPHGMLVPGWAAHDDARLGLLLAPLADSPSAAIGRLVTAGTPVEIPGGDLDRFLQAFYPRLTRAVTVVSSDGSVDLPEIEPPRLALTVTHLPRHRLALDWSLRYRTGETVTEVGIHDTGALPGLRDLPAERVLLASLELPDDRLPQLRGGGDGSRRLVPSVRRTTARPTAHRSCGSRRRTHRGAPTGSTSRSRSRSTESRFLSRACSPRWPSVSPTSCSRAARSSASNARSTTSSGGSSTRPAAFRTATPTACGSVPTRPGCGPTSRGWASSRSRASAGPAPSRGC